MVAVNLEGSASVITLRREWGGFNLAQWQSAVYSVCRPAASWAETSDWEQDILLEDADNEDQSFSDGVALDTARSCLRLLCRLWANPGDRIDYELPEAVLWRWLRHQIVGLVGQWAVPVDGSDTWHHDEPRKDAAVRLRGLLPAEPMSRAERDRTYADRLDAIETDLERANDVLAHLVVQTHAYYQPASPWPALARLSELVDQLVAVRMPPAEPVISPATSPVSIERPRRKPAGRKRVGPPPDEAYAACVALVNEYAKLEGEPPPGRQEFADRLGIKVSTFDDRVAEFRELGFAWPIIAEVAA
ncbi:MAG: hypothetical protein AVDCRST_MAG33-1517 [uncultured Thermomicrobiales bacterium]|uniref:Uncharacterized protein n=1 Tax=uncultured Thermomicrobiales bacterium TaxID=1645740 RepID=A0A6J4UV08_9BACT|nr:MAG: hypothetical protein AVDCRST_MAG33-1517 [uncultured Thermomicrobiales bacterium]